MEATSLRASIVAENRDWRGEMALSLLEYFSAAHRVNSEK
jgi:hypothetical protein